MQMGKWFDFLESSSRQQISFGGNGRMCECADMQMFKWFILS